MIVQNDKNAKVWVEGKKVFYLDKTSNETLASETNDIIGFTGRCRKLFYGYNTINLLKDDKKRNS